MPFCTIKAGATITTTDYHNLRLIFSRMRKLGELSYVRRFVCKAPLTQSQRKHLPVGLKCRMAG